jgi:hypothetical protein
MEERKVYAQPAAGAPPPRRLAADPNHAWYDPFWVTAVEVKLDGVIQKCVILYDADEGWVERYKSTPDGKITGLATEHIGGKVEVRRWPGTGGN